MILDALLRLFYVFIVSLTYLIPSSDSLPEGVTDFFDFIIPYFAQANRLIPLTVMLQIISLIFTIEAGILVFRFIQWAIKKIPWIN